MTGDELIQRRAKDRCIRCGSPDVKPDPETGFVRRLCDDCEADDRQRGGATTAIAAAVAAE